MYWFKITLRIWLTVEVFKNQSHTAVWTRTSTEHRDCGWGEGDRTRIGEQGRFWSQVQSSKSDKRRSAQKSGLQTPSLLYSCGWHISVMNSASISLRNWLRLESQSFRHQGCSGNGLPLVTTAEQRAHSSKAASDMEAWPLADAKELVKFRNMTNRSVDDYSKNGDT